MVMKKDQKSGHLFNGSIANYSVGYRNEHLEWMINHDPEVSAFWRLR